MDPTAQRPASERVTAAARRGRRHRSAQPSVLRGWLYDSLEDWWALLVGAPPAPVV